MNKFSSLIASASILLLSIAGGANAAAPEARSERVDFANGATSRVIKGQVKGFAYVDYPLHAGAGQTLSVEMKSSNASSYFNINPPGSEMSLFIGSTSGARFSGVLPVEGDYTVRVYLMRNAARRNESGNYTLTLGLTGQPLIATPALKDALIPGTAFHASATIACAPPFAAKETTCEAFVIRRGFDGTATVEIRWGDGLKRRILFVKGQASASDAPDAISVVRQGDVNVVSLGEAERFDIPDALIFGG